MLIPRARLIAACLGFAAVSLPALAQADDDAERREMERQIEQAIEELFEDFEMGGGGPLFDQDEAEQLDEAERRLIQEMQQRMIIRQQRERLIDRVAEDFDDEPIELDAKQLVSPFEGKPRAAVVAALGHEDFAVRESAEAFLLTDNTLGEAELTALIEQADSPEQRQRLLRLAEHHVLRQWRERDFGQPPDFAEGFGQPRRAASVGYSYEPVVADENPFAPIAGVRVMATMPGFPGHAHLRRGDIIVQIAGQGMSRNHEAHEITNWVRWRISDHAAGDTMSLAVMRGGELLAIELVCAEGQALDQMYTTDAFETAARKEPYKRAWRDVREAMLEAFPRPKTLTPRPMQ